ncbi:MAG: hypothetical protein IJW05_08005 [Lentisphaeria bacterium]|nr:hypothetical protein [Lentisphaeria bacterium]
MKKMLFWAAALVCCTVMAEIAASYDFDGKTGNAKAAGKFRYVDGFRNKAIALSDGTVRIPCPAKLTPEEGSISFWVKPMNWDSSVTEFLFLLQNNNQEKNGRIIVYKYREPKGLGLMFWMGNPQAPKGKGNAYTNTVNHKLEKGKWTFLTITWSKKANLFALYHNGQLACSGRGKDGLFFKKFGDFILNPPPFRPADRSLETAFDLLKFHTKALSEKEVAALYKEESAPVLDIPMAQVRKTVFTLPVMKTAPRIDGNFIDSEWAEAAKLPGFINLSKPRLQGDLPGEVYAGMDRKNFYFCIVAKIPGATQLVNKVKDRDGAVYMDDAFEIFLRPPEMKQGNYQTIVNYGGAIYDACNSRKQWNGNWTVRNGLYEGLWICEMTIPIADFKSSFAEGKEWEFNFCRDRQIEPDILFSSVSPSAMPFSAYFGKFRMTVQDCFARLSVDYSRLFERKLDLKTELFNLSGKAQKVTVKIEKINQDGSPVQTARYVKTIPAGSSAVIDHADPLSGFRSGVIRVTATGENGKLILSQDLPLVFKDEVKIEIETNLSEAKLTFSADLKSHYALAAAKHVDVTLRHTNGKVSTQRISGSNTVTGTFDLKRFPAGDCVLEFLFRDAAGKELMKVTENYKHIGYPKWLSEKPGMKGIPYPYTPIKRNGNTLSVIGRDHLFGTSLLPEQITSQGVSLFAAKPVLRAKYNGKKIEFRNFKFRKGKENGEAAEMSFTASEGGLLLSGTIRMEYDGFLWYTLDLGKNKGTLEELFLEMELPASVAEFYNAHFFSRENYVGKLGDSLILKQIPSVWLGNMDVGLTFVAESFQYWQNRNEKSAIHVKRNGDNVLWQIRFADKPVSLQGQKFVLEFGIEANPVKPTPPQFRSWRVWFFDPFTIAHPWTIDSKIKKYPGSGGFFTPEHTSMEAFRNEVKRFRDRGAELSLYLNPFLISPEATEYKIFRKEWRNPYNVYPQCPASSFTDYIIWQIDDHIKHGGLQCVYVDSLGAVNCANELHGCGYIDEKGNQKLTFPIRAMRTYMKRLYTLLHAQGRDQKKNYLWAHMSARTSAPINAFVDFQCSGEELETELIGNSNYLEHYSMDAYQVYYMPSSGVVPMLLPNLGRTGPKEHRLNKDYNDQVLALALLHDSLLWNLWMDMTYVNNLYKKLDAFGWQDPGLEFHSYREQKLVTTETKDIFISVYRLGKRALAVVVNKNKTACTADLVIDHKALGIPEGAVLKDFRTGRKLTAQELKKWRIRGYNYSLIQIGE